MCDDAVSVATRKTIRRTRMHNACPSIRCSNSWELLPMGLGLDPHRFRNLCLIGLGIVAQGRGNWLPQVCDLIPMGFRLVTIMFFILQKKETFPLAWDLISRGTGIDPKLVGIDTCDVHFLQWASPPSRRSRFHNHSKADIVYTMLQLFYIYPSWTDTVYAWTCLFPSIMNLSVNCIHSHQTKHEP